MLFFLFIFLSTGIDIGIDCDPMSHGLVTDIFLGLVNKAEYPHGGYQSNSHIITNVSFLVEPTSVIVINNIISGKNGARRKTK